MLYANIVKSMAEAIEYNRLNAEPIEIEGFPDLQLDPKTGSTYSRHCFAWEVLRYQIRFELVEDGKLGPATREHMEGSPDNTGRGFMHNGELIDAPIVCSREFTSGHFSSREGHEIQSVVVHWNGLQVDHCIRTLDGAKASTHFVVGFREGHKDLGVHQLVDTSLKAWHASWANSRSIGIDIAQRPIADDYQKYVDAGYDVSVMDNPATRPDGSMVGQSPFLTLDTDIEVEFNALLHAICDTYDIPKVIVWDNRILSQEEFNDFHGVVMHSSLSAMKWDCAPWAATAPLMFEGFDGC